MWLLCTAVTMHNRCDVWDFVCMIELKVDWIREIVFAIPRDQINNTVSERGMPIRFELTRIMHVLCFSKSGIGVGITKVDCFLFKFYCCINFIYCRSRQECILVRWFHKDLEGDDVNLFGTIITFFTDREWSKSGRTKWNAGNRLSFSPGATNLHQLRTWIVVVT